MEYKERLVCFIDLLGFGEAIKQSEEEPALAARFFELLGEFKDGGLEKAVYSIIPHVHEDEVGSCGEVYGDSILEMVDPEYDLVATQFSDSFVLSAPASNKFACKLLLKAMRVIHVQYFFGVGMLMRGGIAVGNLVHERGGPVFGPAMNEAYGLESKSAIYARVVVSTKASELIKDVISDTPLASSFFTGFDGFTAFDLVSGLFCSDNYRSLISKSEEQLKAVEQDILSRTPSAHPKIAYLKNRWALEKHRYSESADLAQPASQ